MKNTRPKKMSLSISAGKLLRSFRIEKGYPTLKSFCGAFLEHSGEKISPAVIFNYENGGKPSSRRLDLVIATLELSDREANRLRKAFRYESLQYRNPYRERNPGSAKNRAKSSKVKGFRSRGLNPDPEFKKKYEELETVFKSFGMNVNHPEWKKTLFRTTVYLS